MRNRTFFIIIIVFVFLFGCVSSETKERVEKDIAVLEENNVIDMTIDLNPFTFARFYVEQLCMEFDLLFKYPEADIIKSSFEMYKAMTLAESFMLQASGYSDDGSLTITFVPDVTQYSDTFTYVLQSNYDYYNNAIFDGDGYSTQQWSTFLYVVNDELVTGPYYLQNPEEPRYEKTERSDFFLRDMDPENDSRVPGLIMEDLNERTARVPGISKCILIQYYLKQGDMEAAGTLMNEMKTDLRTYLTDDPDGEFSAVYEKTRLEYEIVKRIYENETSAGTDASHRNE